MLGYGIIESEKSKEIDGKKFAPISTLAQN